MAGKNSSNRATIRYSSDLSSWSSATGASDVGGVGSTGAFTGIANIGSTVVAVGEYVASNGTQTSIIYSSTNSTSWTARRTASNEKLNAVAASGSLFVAVGDAGLILTSSDGTTWTQRTSGVSYALTKVSFANGYFFTNGLKSSNGTTWTAEDANDKVVYFNSIY